jgi:hypothetical protein
MVYTRVCLAHDVTLYVHVYIYLKTIFGYTVITVKAAHTIVITL